METAGMDLAASAARLVAGVLSLLYLIVLLPHVAFEPANLLSPWAAGSLLFALLWLPLLWLHVQTSGRGLSRVELAASFAPLVFMGGFFSLLFALA